MEGTTDVRNRSITHLLNHSTLQFVPAAIRAAELRPGLRALNRGSILSQSKVTP
jgi:hypothetical protein